MLFVFDSMAENHCGGGSCSWFPGARFSSRNEESRGGSKSDAVKD